MRIRSASIDAVDRTVIHYYSRLILRTDRQFLQQPARIRREVSQAAYTQKFENYRETL
jgi:hypothetical protein